MADPSHPVTPYPAVPAQPDFPELEKQVLARWAADDTFRESVEGRPGESNEYVFYDGPPFANGMPHYGHLLTGFVKDAVPRYRTMRGRRVERRFGWDCHGLPAEMEAEKELRLAGRAEILQYGVGRFNDYCRSLVQRTTDEWERYVTRQARWVDFRCDYKTMDVDYMESVLWAFKSLWEKGLAYEGYRVLPYCWECETPLSNFETRQDDAYRPRVDPAVTIAFEVEPQTAESGNGTGDGTSPISQKSLRLLVWTTTPWTLPSNLAVAVGPDIDYQVFDLDGALTVMAAARTGEYAELLGEAQPVASVTGAELVGRTYRPLFGFFAGTPGAFRVLAGDFVSTDEGTGIVHLAPGFGEDDQRVCEGNGIAVVCPVDDRGRFTDEVPPYAGLQVFDANPAVIADLDSAGALVDRVDYTHSYPHCWRTDTALIYKAVSSWFVRVSAIKDRMVELNQRIRWVPEHVRDGAFGKWLEGARDWSISRNRFWGAPIPVWKSDDPAYPRIDVYASLDELERDFGVRPDDLHRPGVDQLTRPNPDDPTGASTMRRVPDVLDCWFESGSMPYAQMHYPFENVERFEAHFPADFIVEYIGQTRGWFYTLHVLSTALFDCPPFETCVAHGVVLGDDGRKASKRLGNYPDPDEVFDTLGADAMRWALLSSSVLRGQDLVFERRSVVEATRSVLSPLWNTWHFLSLYANADGTRGTWRTDATGVLDRYLLAKTAALVDEVTGRLEAYDLAGACWAVTTWLDALTNWYVRRSRDRFWRPWSAGGAGAGGAGAGAGGAGAGGAGAPGELTPEDRDKRDAYDTLATVLEVACRVAAPLAPLITEAVYTGLTGKRSVHLTDWPAVGELPADPDLVAAMDKVRDVCSAAHSIRKSAGQPVRHPLASLTVFAPWSSSLEPFVALVAEEVNVKAVHLTDQVEGAGQLVLRVKPAALGPRLGGDTQKVLAAARQGSWTNLDDGTVEVAGTVLDPDEFELSLRPVDTRASRVLAGNDALVTLDLALTPDLVAEGLARDVVRQVQQTRRSADLVVTDRIRLVLELPGAVAAAVEAHRDWVMAQTLAVELEVNRVGAAAATAYRGDFELEGQACRVGIEKIARD